MTIKCGCVANKINPPTYICESKYGRATARMTDTAHCVCAPSCRFKVVALQIYMKINWFSRLLHYSNVCEEMQQLQWNCMESLFLNSCSLM